MSNAHASWGVWERKGGQTIDFGSGWPARVMMNCVGLIPGTRSVVRLALLLALSTEHDGTSMLVLWIQGERDTLLPSRCCEVPL